MKIGLKICARWLERMHNMKIVSSNLRACTQPIGMPNLPRFRARSNLARRVLEREECGGDGGGRIPPRRPGNVTKDTADGDESRHRDEYNDMVMISILQIVLGVSLIVILVLSGLESNAKTDPPKSNRRYRFDPYYTRAN